MKKIEFDAIFYKRVIFLIGINQNLERLETLRDLTRRSDPEDDQDVIR